MAAPFIEMMNHICTHLKISQQKISSVQAFLQGNQPTDEVIDMLSTGIDGMKYATTVITELKETVVLMDQAVFNATVNIEYAGALLEMLSNAMPERHHMAIEALSSFTGAAFKTLESVWDLEKAAAQAMEDEA